jgi:hypothetical protein
MEMSQEEMQKRKEIVQPGELTKIVGDIAWKKHAN